MNIREEFRGFIVMVVLTMNGIIPIFMRLYGYGYKIIILITVLYFVVSTPLLIIWCRWDEKRH